MQRTYRPRHSGSPSSPVSCSSPDSTRTQRDMTSDTGARARSWARNSFPSRPFQCARCAPCHSGTRLLDEDVVGAVPIDHMRICPEPVSGGNDALEPPQGLGEAVTQIEQQNPLVRKQQATQSEYRIPHQMLGEEADELPVPRG